MGQHDLTAARREMDEQFTIFVDESAKSVKHSVKATAARARYMLARDEARALERDVLAYGPVMGE